MAPERNFVRNGSFTVNDFRLYDKTSSSKGRRSSLHFCRNVCAFEECESELLELLSCNDALVCMCGDFNARTGNLCDLVESNVFNDFGSDSATGGLKNHRRFVTSHLCHKSLMSQVTYVTISGLYVPN